MNTIAKIALLTAIAAIIAGCYSMTWVNGLSTTPDGSQVQVVGAQYKRNVFGDIIDAKPARWVCLRGPDGRLTCTADTSKLPQVE